MMELCVFRIYYEIIQKSEYVYKSWFGSPGDVLCLAGDAGAQQTEGRAFRKRRKVIKVKQKETSRITKTAVTEVLFFIF